MKMKMNEQNHDLHQLNADDWQRWGANQVQVRVATVQSELVPHDRLGCLAVREAGVCCRWLTGSSDRYSTAAAAATRSENSVYLRVTPCGYSPPRDWNVTFSVNGGAQGVISHPAEASVGRWGRCQSGTCSRRLQHRRSGREVPGRRREVPGRRREAVSRLESPAALRQRTRRQRLLLQSGRTQRSRQGSFGWEVSNDPRPDVSR